LPELSKTDHNLTEIDDCSTAAGRRQHPISVHHRGILPSERRARPLASSSAPWAAKTSADRFKQRAKRRAAMNGYRFARHRLTQCFVTIACAVAVTVLLPPILATAAPAGVRMPFPCGETWYAHTRSNHSPHVNAVDWNLHPGDDEGRGVLAGVSGTADVPRPGDVGYDANYGEYVKVVDGAWTYLYAHLSAISVHDGQTVGVSTEIGKVGNTGNSDGAHLHYEQRHNGQLVPFTFDGITFNYSYSSPGNSYRTRRSPLTAVLHLGSGWCS
jgi:hypothetical protein